MPYTPPSQRSPAASTSSSPNISRRSSYGTGSPVPPPAPSARPDLPRSTSYLTRHRRTPSVKSTAFAHTPDVSEPTPPGTAESDTSTSNGLSTSGSLRQSPPPVTDDSKIPTGVVLSPPESAQNSSDDEESEESRGRELENLAELQAAIRIIGQHRASSPARGAADIAKANQALTFIMPDKALDIKLIPSTREGLLGSEAKKIGHSRSNTDSAVFIDLRQPSSESTSPTGSDEDESDEEGDRSRRKPPMLRKKSGELVRPALRGSSRRRPSSMPGTPTFSKAVHFDSHLEHVRHFLQVDRPLAVSAGSSPVENYESETEFPFSDEDSSKGRSPPYEWEISLANFPSDTHERLRLPVRVERVFLSNDNKNMIGVVAVANLAFHKTVAARFTLDYWKTTSEVVAEYNNDVRRKQSNDGYDRFNFSIKLADQANLEAKTMFFCVKYAVNGTEYWDNNNNTNFQVDFKKKSKPQNGKRGMQGAASRPANGLPRSNSKKSSQPLQRPRTMPATFDDFADGFDSTTKFDFNNFKKPVSDLIGESSNPSLRLKGSQSAVDLGSDNLTRRNLNHNGQAFSNRYDFGASLSAAIQAANNAMGDRSGLIMKPASRMKESTPIEKGSSPARNAQNSSTQLPVPGTSGRASDSPRLSGTEAPMLASQSYNELLDKYCFFGSSKSSPQLKDGTLNSRPAQYDGSDDHGYIFASASSSPDSRGSPQMQNERKYQSARNESSVSSHSGRSTSPAPMTGLATGTSPVYPYHAHGGFPFSDAYKPTAIRG